VYLLIAPLSPIVNDDIIESDLNNIEISRDKIEKGKKLLKNQFCGGAWIAAGQDSLYLYLFFFFIVIIYCYYCFEFLFIIFILKISFFILFTYF
jgi:hypothetical protein